MIKKLTKHGNSLALIIDKPILDILKIDSGTPLELSTDGKNLLIKPLNDRDKNRKLDSALNRVVTNYGETFKKLAE